MSDYGEYLKWKEAEQVRLRDEIGRAQAELASLQGIGSTWTNGDCERIERRIRRLNGLLEIALMVD